VAVHVERELAVGVDVRPEQRREGSAVGVGGPVGPRGFAEDAFDEQGVDVDEG
jgi:hypothetical protein